MDEKIIENLSYEYLQGICGVQDEYIKIIADKLLVELSIKGNNLIINGDRENVAAALKVVTALLDCLKQQKYFAGRELIYLCQLALTNQEVTVTGLYDTPIISSHKGKAVYPKTNNQKLLFEAMCNYDVVFAVGPAGTGKTYLAVAYALALFKSQKIEKIILTRPAVEAGENLGFLPGDLKEKIDPYLRPLYDALYDILGAERVSKYLEQGVIEVAPLAFMRGRTLERAFVILDEAQNTTMTQMKMFLTRLGFNSKMVVTGDITQIDLPKSQTCGLVHAIKVLEKIKEIKVVELSSIDVVRSPLVQKIIDAYQIGENH